MSRAHDASQSSRKRTGKGKVQTPPYDQSRFVCYEASQVYEKNLRKALVPKRGIDYASFGLNVFAERGSHNTTVQSGNAAKPIVREFYANTGFRTEGRMVIVRGIMVSFSTIAINNFFDIPPSDDEYLALYKRSDNDRNVLHQFLPFIAIEGAEWSNFNGAALLKENMLTRNSKAIHRFICGRMMPTGHRSEVSIDRAVMNYAIQTRMLVNFGVAVFNAISFSLRNVTTGGYVFSQLITELCWQAGVVWEDSIEVFKPHAYIKCTGGFGRVRGALGQVVGQGHGQEEEEGEQNQGDAQVPFPGQDYFGARFDALEASQRDLSEQFGGLRGDFLVMRNDIGEMRGVQMQILHGTDVSLQRLDSMNYMM